MEARLSRRLAVILHADVAGSTRLVQIDELRAHKRMLDAFRRLSSSIEARGGKTRELRGDALVAEFSLASDAVCAAVEFQQHNARFNASLDDDVRPALRIGIAMGEVIVDGNMITGEGVVMAQRLEQIADRDGVCLQGAAYETVPKRLPLEFDSLGERSVKGFDEAVRAFAVRGKPDQPLPPSAIKVETRPLLEMLEAETLPAVPSVSVAVLPFGDPGGEPGGEHLGLGISANIHSDLTRFRDLFVSGRTSCAKMAATSADVAEIASRLGVQYVVRGTVRAGDSRIRIVAELVDGGTGRIVWSERYDRVLRDIFEVETEVSNAIAAALSVNIAKARYERAKHFPPEHLGAYDWLLRGNRSLELGGADNLGRAKLEFSRALELEPDFAAACAGLSIAYGYECGELLADDYQGSLERHRGLAERAIALDESDCRGHYAMSCAYQLTGRRELADLHAARAVELNPSEYHNLCNRGYTLMSLGQVHESAAFFNESLRRNPLAPNSCLLALGQIEYFERNYAQSAIALSRMSPSYLQRDSSLAAAYAQLGYAEEARAAAQAFLGQAETRPAFPRSGDSKDWQGFWRLTYPYGDKDAFEHVLDGLAKAGLPL